MEQEFFSIPRLVPIVLLLCVCGQFASAEVRGPPHVTTEAIEHYRTAVVGSAIRLRCPVVGTPPPLTMWKKGDDTINSGWERFKVQLLGLRIEDLVIEDSGRYICKATNGFGSVNINFTLTVTESREPKGGGRSPPLDPEQPALPEQGALPVFSQREKMLKKILIRPMKSMVRLRCKATGKPKPEIVWEKDGRSLSDADYSVDEPSKRMWVLKLMDIQVQDSGDYTCLVFNKHGKINATYRLEVIEPINEKPELTGDHPVNTTVAYGGSTSFQCRVKSDIQPHIQWLKRVEPHNAYLYANASVSLNGEKYAVIPTGKAQIRPDGTFMNKLVIPRATEEDAGMYICLGANVIGYSFKSAFLEVLPNPNNNVPTGDETPTSGRKSMSNQVKLILIIALPLASALLFVIIVFLCTCNKSYSRSQRTGASPLPKGEQISNRDYHQNDFRQKAHLNYQHNFSRTSGSNPYLGSESERSAILCSQNHSQSDGYNLTIAEKVVGRYADMPYNPPPSVYSDTTLNSQRSVSTGWGAGGGLSRNHSNQHHLVTC